MVDKETHRGVGRVSHFLQVGNEKRFMVKILKRSEFRGHYSPSLGPDPAPATTQPGSVQKEMCIYFINSMLSRQGSNLCFTFYSSCSLPNSLSQQRPSNIEQIIPKLDPYFQNLFPALVVCVILAPKLKMVGDLCLS